MLRKYFLIIVYVLLTVVTGSTEELLKESAVFQSSGEALPINRLNGLFESFTSVNNINLSFNLFDNKSDTKRFIYQSRPQIGFLDYNYFQESGKEYNLIPALIAERYGQPFYTIIFLKRKDYPLNSFDDIKIAVYSNSYERANHVFRIKFKESLNKTNLMKNYSRYDSFISLLFSSVNLVIAEESNYLKFKESNPAESEQFEIIYTHQPLPNQLAFIFGDNKTKNTDQYMEEILKMQNSKTGKDLLNLLQYSRWIKVDENILKRLNKTEPLQYSYLPKHTLIALNDNILPGMIEEKKTVQYGKKITILKSGNLSIYNEAIGRFKESMTGADIKEYALQDDMKITELGTIGSLKNSDLIFTLGSAATVMAKKIAQTKTVPIVFAMVPEPDRNNIPEEYVSGIQTRVSLISSIVPLRTIKKFSKIGVIISKENIEFIKKEEEMLRLSGTQLLKEEIGNEDITSVFVALKKKGIEVLWLYPDKWLTSENFKKILEESIEAKIPLIAPTKDFVVNGAFMSVYPDDDGIGNQAAVMGKELFSAKNKPVDLKTEYPSSTKIACNKSTAKKIDLELNSDFIQFCNDVYE